MREFFCWLTWFNIRRRKNYTNALNLQTACAAKCLKKQGHTTQQSSPEPVHLHHYVSKLHENADV